MTTKQAIVLAAYIARRLPKVDRMLRAKCEETGRARSFIIMRFGDPRKWKSIPKGKLKPLVHGKRRFHSLKTYKNVMAIRRPCVLQHINSGRVISTKSITAFCRKARLGKTAKYHITPVLNHLRPSYKGWFRPDVLAKRLQLRDRWGNVYEDISVQDAIKQYKLSTSTIFSLLNGKKDVSRGLTLASTEDKAFLRPRATQIVGVTLRKGTNVVRSKSLVEAAAEIGLHKAALYPMAYGISSQANGYRLTEVRTKRRQALKAPIQTILP